MIKLLKLVLSCVLTILWFAICVEFFNYLCCWEYSMCPPNNIPIPFMLLVCLMPLPLFVAVYLEEKT